MATIKLRNINCMVPDEIDKDEMFLKFKGKKIWPTDHKYFRIQSNEAADVQHTMDVQEGWVEIELWDYDLTSFNDLLGTFRLKVDDHPGSYSASLTRNEKKSHTASYLLNWEIL